MKPTGGGEHAEGELNSWSDGRRKSRSRWSSRSRGHREPLFTQHIYHLTLWSLGTQWTDLKTGKKQDGFRIKQSQMRKTEKMTSLDKPCDHFLLFHQKYILILLLLLLIKITSQHDLNIMKI